MPLPDGFTASFNGDPLLEMTASQRYLFARHPLCICGPFGFDGGFQGVVTTEGCRLHARDTYGIDPHPVVSAEDVQALVSALRARMTGAAAPEAGKADA